MHGTVLVAHSSFIEWSHTTKNTAFGHSFILFAYRTFKKIFLEQSRNGTKAENCKKSTYPFQTRLASRLIFLCKIALKNHSIFHQCCKSLFLQPHKIKIHCSKNFNSHNLSEFSEFISVEKKH